MFEKESPIMIQDGASKAVKNLLENDYRVNLKHLNGDTEVTTEFESMSMKLYEVKAFRVGQSVSWRTSSRLDNQNNININSAKSSDRDIEETLPPVQEIRHSTINYQLQEITYDVLRFQDQKEAISFMNNNLMIRADLYGKFDAKEDII